MKSLDNILEGILDANNHSADDVVAIKSILNYLQKNKVKQGEPGKNYIKVIRDLMYNLREYGVSINDVQKLIKSPNDLVILLDDRESQGSSFVCRNKAGNFEGLLIGKSLSGGWWQFTHWRNKEFGELFRQIPRRAYIIYDVVDIFKKEGGFATDFNPKNNQFIPF